jgi:hypothetical protein
MIHQIEIGSIPEIVASKEYKPAHKLILIQPPRGVGEQTTFEELIAHRVGERGYRHRRLGHPARDCQERKLVKG